METVRDDKTVLRRKFKDLRRGFRAAGGRLASEQLVQNLERFLSDYKDVQCCLYRAQRDEAPCPLHPVTQYFYPVLKGEELEFRKPHAPESFRLNALALSEPITDESSALNLDQPVVVCCPALAVDAQGVRLGMGKGFYDRFFSANTQALRVGVVYQIQISATPLPAESWDQPLDWIVSDKMILRTPTSTRSSQTWI